MLISLTASAPVLACLWDFDTLAVERQRFPSVLELITGKFLRHSDRFYQWRVRDRQRRLREQPSPAIYDDLAVAYEKLGETEKAIAITLQKAERFPGLYETEANLGTFYIHSGQLERGVQSIERAIAMNPDAHFGREVYQKHLVNYVLSKQTNGTTQLPLDDSKRLAMAPLGFAGYLLDMQNATDSGEARDAELKKAMQGVLGMMRFGNHDSPILLEALGDLLLSRGYPEDAKRLAARAYLKASYAENDEATRKAYRELAAASLSMQTVHRGTYSELSLDALEAEFAEERAQANRWFEAVVEDERKWISEGRNLDEAFAQKYYQEPEVFQPANVLPWALVGGAVAFVVIGLAWLRRRSRAARTPTAT